MRFSNDLILWYSKYKRDLPWRKTKNAYSIWLSEIILQQTRVDQGLSYYNKFIENYPTVKHLANAKEDEVLKLWQGLGYYSRARNLHYTAKIITKEYNGSFPKTHKEILELKGIGEYTAAAISSFAYNQPYPVIDGNVYRVLSRVFGINEAIDTTNGKKKFSEIAHELIDKKNPAEYNQAIMEFGALNCTPKKPMCGDCIFKLECYAFKNGKIDSLPRKEKKIKQKNRYFNYLVCIDGDEYIYIKQRNKKDIWQGLYDFPLIESKNKVDNFDHLKEGNQIIRNFTLVKKSNLIKHILSHQKIYTVFWEIKLKKNQKLDDKYLRVSLKEINNYPVPKLLENYIKTNL